MAFLGQSLADGQIADAKATIYTAPALTRVIVRSFDLGNDSENPVTVKLYIKRSGSVSRFIGSAILEAGEVFEVLSQGKVLVISAGDEIEAEATLASLVDYTLTGAAEV